MPIGRRPNYSAPSTPVAAMMANDGQRFGGLSSAPVSWRDRVTDDLGRMIPQSVARNAMSAVDFVPYAGDAAGVADAFQDFARGERLMPAANLAMAALPLPAAIKKGMIGAGRKLAQEAGDGLSRIRPGEVLSIDPRFEKRKRELPRASAMEVSLQRRATNAPQPQSLSIFDLEGQPFITSMSDMSAAGDDIVGINDVAFRSPVSRLGGQDYMFDQAGAVWAADKGNARKHVEMAQELKQQTGKDPLFLPWTMGPGAIDFSHMPRETMLQYSSSTMKGADAQELSRAIQSIVPDFRSLDDAGSLEVFRQASGKKRAQLNKLLDQWRERSGLGIGAARLATTDLGQVGNRLTTLRNVGRIDSSGGLGQSLHPSYNVGVPGEGMGRLREEIGALDLLPRMMADAGLTDPFGFPIGVVKGVKSPLRALQMAPQGGMITEKKLRAIQDRLEGKQG